MSTYDWPSEGGVGTVTSVGLADGSTIPIYGITGSPVTTSGTLTFTLATQSANKVFAGPTTGSAAQPGFRSLVAADISALFGDLTDAGTDGIVITGGTGAVRGSGTSIAQHVADSTHNGYLSSTDWTTFNNKQSALTLTNLTDVGTDGITITNGTGAVIGASAVTIAQHVADSTHNGYLSSTDWTTFNGKGAGSVTQVALTVPTFLSISGSPITTSGTLAITLSGTALPVASGGTGVTSVTTAPAATAWAGWDANKNLSANNVLDGYATTATGAATTTLVVGDAGQQVFTGSTTQTVKLPVVSTLVLGMQYIITNLSSGVVTVQSSGANTLQAMAANTQLTCTVIAVTGTGTSSWNWVYQTVQGALPATGSVTSVSMTVPAFLSISGSPITNSGTLAVTLSGTALPIANGGTGVTAVSTAPAATTFAGWDANSNLSANALIPSYTSTATAAGTTTMTIASTQTQVWTGSSTQTVRLPTTSVAAGATYTIVNNSTGNVTVQSSGANSIVILSGNQTAVFISTKATPTAAADWIYYTNTQNKLYAFYTGNAGTALTANTTNIDWATKVVDSHSAWNGTTFTAPTAGFYLFSFGVFTTAGVTATIGFYIGGTIKNTWGAGVSSRVFNGSAGYYMNSGDTLTFRSDTNATLSNSAAIHWISIAGQ